MKIKRKLSLILSIFMVMSSQVVFADNIEIDHYSYAVDKIEDSVEKDNDADLKAEDVVKINSAVELFNIRNIEDWNTKSYELTSDIDLNDILKLSDEEKTGELKDLLEGENWISFEETFSGEFNGNGHTIKNLTQKQFKLFSNNQGIAGLFSQIGNAEKCAKIYNLNFENANIQFDKANNNDQFTNLAYAGTLCGNIRDKAIVSNCNVNGTVISAGVVGGLCGDIVASYIEIEKCSVNNADLSIEGKFKNAAIRTAGGMIGKIQSRGFEEGSIIDSNKVSQIKCMYIDSGDESQYSMYAYLGGFLGYFFNVHDFCITNLQLENIILKENYNSLKDKTQKIYIGGITGRNKGQSFNGINIKDLKIDTSKETIAKKNVYAGGIVGGITDFVTEKSDDGTTECKTNIENTYVSFTDDCDKEVVKPFSGEQNTKSPDEYNGVATNCYYDIDQYKGDITDQPSGVIPVTYAIASKTAASDKAEDASASDDILNTKTSAEFTVKAYAVEKNEDGSVKYDETTGEPVVGDEIEGFMDRFGSAVSVTDWRVAAGESIGEGDDAVKCDDAVTADNTSVKAGTDGLSATLTSSANAGTKEAPANIIIAAKVNGVEKKLAVPYYYVRSHSSSGGGGGGSAATPTTETTTKTNADGSTTVTVKNNTTGTVTETTTAKDGTKTVVETTKDGIVTTTVTKPNGTSLKTVKAADGSITISTGSKSAVKTEIPAAGAGAGTVAVRVKADGSEEIIKNSIVNDGKVIFMANDGDVIKIRNNGTSFSDVAAGSWMSDAVAYVSGRELFKGVSDNEFGPSGSMTRGMLATVLYRYAGAPAAAAANGFSDITSGAYYADAVNWAAANGIVTGYSDGTFAPDKSVTREQLAAILYRYAGSPQESAALDSFNDAGSVSDYAANAVAWAVKAGIISGNGDSATLDPKGTATRAQVATMIKRFAEYQMAQ